MKIKTRLRFNAWISVGAVIIILLSLAWSLWEVYRKEQNVYFVDEMRKVAFERTVLRDDYIVHHEERAKIQWLAKSEHLRTLLESALDRFPGKEDKALLQKARGNFDATFSIFSEVLKRYGEKEGPAKKEPAFDEGESRLISQVFLRAYALNDDITKLREAAGREATQARSRGVWIIVLLVMGGVLAITLNTAAISGILARRVAALAKGVGIIGDGNLEHHIDVEGNDELSDLARASNEMAAKLRQSYTSIENLRREIAERRKAEEALRESETTYRSLFENMLNGFSYCRMLFEQSQPVDFTYISVNNSFKALTGLRNVVGKKVSEVIPGLRQSNPEIFRIYGRVSLTGEPERFDTYIKALDMWFSISVYSPLKGYFVAVFDVITERKRADEELRASLGFLEAVHNNREIVPLLKEFVSKIKDYTGCDAVGIRVLGENGEIPYRAYEGFSREFYESENPLSVGVDQCMCIDVLNGPTDATLPFYTKGGSFYMNGTTRFLATVPEEEKGWTRNACNEEGYESVTLIPVRGGNLTFGLIHVADHRENMVPLRVVQVLEKVALQLGTALERVRTEEEVRRLNAELEQRVAQRTAQLEVANKELESFAYSVSHDLRAPLRGIDGWSQALLDDYGDRLDKQAHKFLTRIRSETQQMGWLIDDLLKLSRVARTEIQPMPTDLTAMARSIAVRLQEEKPDRIIEFIIPPALKINGDAQLLNIMLTNLFDNAVKFTGTRSHARIEFGEAEMNGSTVFYVRDNGVGFDMTHADKLFGAFQRFHKSSEFPGTGIGLATVQRIVHRHGGGVWAEAEIDKGATFYFTLPAFLNRGKDET